MYIAKQLLDIVATFCKYMNMQRKRLGETINVNDVEIKELEEGDTYKYLGQDESVAYNGPINNERVLKEYLKRVKTI